MTPIYMNTERSNAEIADLLIGVLNNRGVETLRHHERIFSYGGGSKKAIYVNSGEYRSKTVKDTFETFNTCVTVEGLENVDRLYKAMCQELKDQGIKTTDFLWNGGTGTLGLSLMER